ncbi:MAG TPA: tetratricopeptide repeat protein [Bacteroidia bacterium]|nr:tetratricopeptide repeat protein [Bacteroidia bacterium]
MQARRTADWAAQGIAGTEIAMLHLHKGNVALAFDWVNRVLLLDSLITPLSPIRQRMHRNIAGIYTDFEAHQLALPHYKLALEIDIARDPQSTPRRFRHSSAIAICFQQAGEMDSAFHYYHRCIGIADALDAPLWKASALNNLGMALQTAGKPDSALALFGQAYQILDSSAQDELEFAVSVRDNIGLALLELGRPAEALAQFQVNFDDYLARPNQGVHLQAGLRLVRTLVALRRGPEAAALLADMWDFANNAHPTLLPRQQKPLLETGIAVAASNADWETAASLQARLLRHEDSIRSTALRVKVSTLEDMLLDKTANFKTELALMQQNAAAARARARGQTLLALAAAMLAVLLLIVLRVSNRRRVERVHARHQAEAYHRELAELSLKNERLENAQLNQELEMKKRDITDYALVYSQRRKIFEELLDDLKQIKRSATPEKSLHDLVIAIRGKIDGEGKLNLESQHIEKVNNAFFEKLKQSYPGLGASELELCGMIRLGYSAKDIAAMRNIAPPSVRIAKTRLKKKMGLGPDVDLEDFLHQQ